MAFLLSLLLPIILFLNTLNGATPKTNTKCPPTCAFKKSDGMFLVCCDLNPGWTGCGSCVDPCNLERPRKGCCVMHPDWKGCPEVAKVPTTSSTPPMKCDPGWTKWGNKCYKATLNNDTTANSFYTAQHICHAKGAELVSIHSLKEHEFVKDLIMSAYNKCNYGWCKDSYIGDGYWIGMELEWGQCCGEIDDISWADFTSVEFGDPRSHKKKGPWRPGQPKFGFPTNDCVFYAMTMENQLGWQNYNCDKAFIAGGYVCEKPARNALSNRALAEGQMDGGILLSLSHCAKFERRGIQQMCSEARKMETKKIESDLDKSEKY